LGSWGTEQPSNPGGPEEMECSMPGSRDRGTLNRSKSSVQQARMKGKRIRKDVFVEVEPGRRRGRIEVGS